eukprot:PhF_6_TR43398/c0_g1_i2/m.66635
MSSSQLISASSKVSSVTVFPQRAQILRTSSLSIQAGDNTVEFPDLPTTMDRASLQVSCSKSTVDGIILKGVNFAQIRTTVDNNDRRKALEAELAELRLKEQELQDRIAAIRVHQTNVLSLFEKTATATKSDPHGVYDPVAWDKSVQYQKEGIKKSRAELREVERQLRPLQASIATAQVTLNTIAAVEHKSKEVVRVFLSSPNGSGAIVLNITYVVPQASWTASYDVRVDSATEKTTLVYQAIVKQWTHEDWVDIPVELSTAQAHLSGTQPELQPRRLQIQPKISRSRRSYSKKFSYSQKECVEDLAKFSYQEECDDMDFAFEDRCAEPMMIPVATVSEKATSFSFVVPGIHTILCNSQPKRLSVQQGDLQGDFSYVTVPKVMPQAYLQVNAINTLGCPMLTGEIHVFLDNNYVTTSSTQGVPMGEEFSVWLGVDDGIVVKHKLIRRNVTEHGSSISFGGKKKRITYEYLMSIKNTKAKTEEVTIVDQVPLSSDGDIAVNLIEPVAPPLAKETDTVRFNPETGLEYTETEGLLKWKKKIASGETVTIKFSFNVQHSTSDNVPLP